MNAKEIIHDLIGHLEGVEDEGPEGEGWQSNGLVHSINRAQAFIDNEED